MVRKKRITVTKGRVPPAVEASKRNTRFSASSCPSESGLSSTYISKRSRQQSDNLKANSRNSKRPRQSSRNNGKVTVEKRKPLNHLQEIRKLQNSYNLLIPRANFGRLCREIFLEYGGRDLRVQYEALDCLQESAEMYMVQFFEDAYLCALHARRRTLMNKDLRLARRIGGRAGSYL